MKSILFSTPMVQAILAGRKTQTRRVNKGYQPSNAVHGAPIVVGDILWVRETHIWCEECGRYLYRADGPRNVTWKPSIFMPREACRIFLKVTGVRAERLQDITEADAIAEGVLPMSGAGLEYENHVGAYFHLWDTLNGKRGYGSETNPRVWVYEFKRCEKPA